MLARKIVSSCLSVALFGVFQTSCNKKSPEPDVQEMTQEQKVQEHSADAGEEQGQMEEGMQGQGMMGRGMGPGMGRGMGPGMMGQGMMGRMKTGCPMLVQNAEVELEQTDDGVALEFTAKNDDVDSIHQWAKQLAQMYEMHEGRYHMTWRHVEPGGQGKMMKGQDPMASAGRMPAVKATVEGTETGARIVLVPKEESQLETLRQHIKGHKERMTSGQYWSLQQEEEQQKEE